MDNIQVLKIRGPGCLIYCCDDVTFSIQNLDGQEVSQLVCFVIHSHIVCQSVSQFIICCLVIHSHTLLSFSQSVYYLLFKSCIVIQSVIQPAIFSFIHSLFHSFIYTAPSHTYVYNMLPPEWIHQPEWITIVVIRTYLLFLYYR